MTTVISGATASEPPHWSDPRWEAVRIQETDTGRSIWWQLRDRAAGKVWNRVGLEIWPSP